MKKKIVLFSVLEGSVKEIKELRDNLVKMKSEGKIPEHYEFIFTNEKIKLKSAKWFINEFFKLFEEDRKLRGKNVK